MHGRSFLSFSSILIGIAALVLFTTLNRPFDDLMGSTDQSDLLPVDKNLPGVALLSIRYPLSEFELIDHRGNSFTRVNLEGHWNILFFGYTHCPDICPITLQTLSDSIPLFEKDPSLGMPKIVFVSIDPKNDEVHRLREYVDFFHPSIIGITGSSLSITAFTSDIGAMFNKHDVGTTKDPLFSHSSSLFLVDPMGRLAATIDPPNKPEDFHEILRKVRELL